MNPVELALPSKCPFLKFHPLSVIVRLQAAQIRFLAVSGIEKKKKIRFLGHSNGRDIKEFHVGANWMHFSNGEMRSQMDKSFFCYCIVVCHAF